ncbi:MAG TPA: hypothetical protein VLZ03_06915 [Thermodesulfobacteriota bacterium]|nr:hypothetical protein [Thermodesulfobacteriota bacterium]
MTALIQVTLNAGLMKARKGFTLVAGKEKLGGKSKISIDSRPRTFI